MISTLPIRLVGFDLDGTLLNERFEFTQRVIKAFRETNQADLRLLVITGRDKLSASPLLKMLDLDKTVITSGGAQVWLDGNLIRHLPFTAQQTRDILSIGLKYGVGMYVDQPEQTWRFGSRHYTELFGHVSDSTECTQADHLLDPLPIKISLIQEPDVLREIRAHMLALHPQFTITSPFEKVLDLNPQDANKGSALTFLAQTLGISMSQTAVVGDSENDLSMFAVSSWTYAMGNAVAALKERAMIIAPGNHEDGAAWVIQDIRERNKS